MVQALHLDMKSLEVSSSSNQLDSQHSLVFKLVIGLTVETTKELELLLLDVHNMSLDWIMLVRYLESQLEMLLN